MSEIGYQYWLKCRPERLTFSSIGQGSISLTPAVQQGDSRLVVQVSVVRYRLVGARLYFSKCARVNEMPFCMEDNSVYTINGILPPSNKGRGNPSRTGTDPHCPWGADTTGYWQSSDRAWAMWVEYRPERQTFRTVSDKGRMGISLTSFNKSRGQGGNFSDLIQQGQRAVSSADLVEYRKGDSNTVQNERDWVNFRLEYLALRAVLGKIRERQGISLPHPIKAGAAAPVAPWGRRLWTIWRGKANTFQNEREWVRSLLEHLAFRKVLYKGGRAGHLSAPYSRHCCLYNGAGTHGLYIGRGKAILF